jgi:hypothetical protein
MAISRNLLLILKSSGLGEGEPDLGEKLLLSFLKKLADQGTEILSCSTCLNYYGRQNKLLIGQATTMKDTVEAMLNFPKVLSL